MRTDNKAAEERRKKLLADVELYLLSGGTIQELPASGDENRGGCSKWGSSEAERAIVV